MLTLMLRSVIVSGLAFVAALLLEGALRSVRASWRHAWTLAVLASATLPFLPRLVSEARAPIDFPAISLPSLTIGIAPVSHQHNYTAIVWLLLTCAVLLVYAAAYVRLHRARRKWSEENVAGEDVYVSPDFGPAVFGFTRPRIVLPEWVRAASPEEQKLIVLHEREHIQAADHLLLLVVLAATAWMPWNPFIWLQARRLRFALEADCDQRVLASSSDAARYAQLLVDVGGRQTGLLVTAALAEHRNGLERRIGMIATRIVHNRWKAAALTAVSVVVGVVACESRLPTETQKPQEAKVVLERDASDATLSQIVPDTGARAVLLRKVAADGRDAELIKQLGAKVDLKESHMRVMSDKPSYTPYTDLPQLQNREEVLDAIQGSYPPLLRGAGISGRAILWTLIDQDGHVLSSKIAQSSGRLELDKAALEVAHEMKFKPALNHGEAVPVWIQLPVEFK